MSFIIALLPGVLGSILKALLEFIFSGETVATVSETTGIEGADVQGGSKPRLNPDDLPAF